MRAEIKNFSFNFKKMMREKTEWRKSLEIILIRELVEYKRNFFASFEIAICHYLYIMFIRDASVFIKLIQLASNAMNQIKQFFLISYWFSLRFFDPHIAFFFFWMHSQTREAHHVPKGGVEEYLAVENSSSKFLEDGRRREKEGGR